METKSRPLKLKQMRGGVGWGGCTVFRDHFNIFTSSLTNESVFEDEWLGNGSQTAIFSL